LRLLVLCGFEPTSTFSYHTAWPRHLAADSRFQCTIVNLLDRRWFARSERNDGRAAGYEKNCPVLGW